jgi:uncharacterized cupin superfamily protein
VIQSADVDVLDLYDDEWPDGTEREGFRNRERPLRAALGAEQLGGTVYLIEPGQRICPYHWHFGEEEWLIALEGSVTVRTPAGERELSRGNVTSFPTGPGGAHAVCCSGPEPARVLMLSTLSDPEVCVYPDSGKVSASGGFTRTDGARARLLNREQGNLEYFDGE